MQTFFNQLINNLPQTVKDNHKYQDQDQSILCTISATLDKCLGMMSDLKTDMTAIQTDVEELKTDIDVIMHYSFK